MKNKQKTYGLIAAVLLVWGLIALKINTGLRPSEPPAVASIQNQHFIPIPRAEQDSFSIQKLDRDPFLGTLHKPPKAKKKTSPPAELQISKQIAYNGLIQKTTQKSPVFVVNINNLQYVLKKGQIVDSVMLVKGTVDEIVVRYNKQLHTIKRSQ